MSLLQKLALAFALSACIASPQIAIAGEAKATVPLVMFSNYLHPGETLGLMFHMTTDVNEQKAMTNERWQRRYDQDQIYVFDGPVAGTVPLYRYYNHDVQDHFFTTNRQEGRNAVAKLGYADEGVCCYVSGAQQANTTPLWRLFNPGTGIHLYTTSDSQRDQLRFQGKYRFEGAEGFVWTGPVALAPEVQR
jgi:hypothetical protein